MEQPFGEDKTLIPNTRIGFRSRCRYHKGDANQVVNAGAEAQIHFTVLEFDGLAEFDPTAPNWHFIPTQTGYYVIGAKVGVNTTGVLAQKTGIMKLKINAVEESRTQRCYGVVAGVCYADIESLMYLVAGNIVTATYTNLSAQIDNIIAGLETHFWVHRLS